MYGLNKLNKVIQMDEEQKEFDEQQKLHPKNPFDNGGRVGAVVIVPKLTHYDLLKWATLNNELTVSLKISENAILIGEDIYKLRDELNHLTLSFEAQ